jgi:hypothetical protein
MENKRNHIKTNRELAIEWWDNLPTWGNPSKEYLMGLYYSDDNVTPERIEEIWRKEVNQITENVFSKPNQKQFKEFNPDLFKAYISKFSDEDKLKALKIVFFAQTKRCPITLASSILEYCDE